MDEVQEVVEMTTNLSHANLIIVIVTLLVAVVFVTKNIMEFKKMFNIKNGFEIHEEEQNKKIRELKDELDTVKQQVSDLKSYSKEAKEKRLQFEIDTTDTLKEIREDMIKNRVDTLRSRILEFGSSCKIKDYTKENFDYILKSADEYHALLNRYNMSNSQTDMAMEFIRKKYKAYMDSGFPNYQQ